MDVYQNNPSKVAADDARLTARAWVVFALTFSLMLLDFIDRQIIISMFPYLKRDWLLSDKQLGALTSVVALTVALGTLPFAALADRLGRVKTIVVMALVWIVMIRNRAFSHITVTTRKIRQVFPVGLVQS